METDLSRHVLDVMAYGLSLKERLSAGESLLLDVENARLKQMLLGEGAIRGHADYGDTVRRPVQPDERDFLGARYAIACWLDEIFISDPECLWCNPWREKSLEAEIYGGGQERAWRFWSQADLADKRPGTEAVEVFFWCVMLGFRGSPSLVDPKEWAERARRRVVASRNKEIRLPADMGVRTNVSPLRNRGRALAAVRLFVVVLAAALLVGTLVVTQMFKN